MYSLCPFNINLLISYISYCSFLAPTSTRLYNQNIIWSLSHHYEKSDCNWSFLVVWSSEIFFFPSHLKFFQGDDFPSVISYYSHSPKYTSQKPDRVLFLFVQHQVFRSASTHQNEKAANKRVHNSSPLTLAPTIHNSRPEAASKRWWVPIRWWCL